MLLNSVPERRAVRGYECAETGDMAKVLKVVVWGVLLLIVLVLFLDMEEVLLHMRAHVVTWILLLELGDKCPDLLIGLPQVGHINSREVLDNLVLVSRSQE